MVEDLRKLLHHDAGRRSEPMAMILDSRALQSTPKSGARAGYDGAKRRKGSKIHTAVDTPGHPLVLRVTAAGEQDRAQVGLLVEAVQQSTSQQVELAYVDQGYTSENAAAVRKSTAFNCRWTNILKPSEASSCCPAVGSSNELLHGQRFRRLARAYERFAASLAALHYLAFACVVLATSSKPLPKVNNSL